MVWDIGTASVRAELAADMQLVWGSVSAPRPIYYHPPVTGVEDRDLRDVPAGVWDRMVRGFVLLEELEIESQAIGAWQGVYRFTLAGQFRYPSPGSDLVLMDVKEHLAGLLVNRLMRDVRYAGGWQKVTVVRYQQAMQEEQHREIHTVELQMEWRATVGQVS